MVGERGDERVPGRTRSEGRQLSVVPEEAVSTPLPEATSFGHGVGLLSHAGSGGEEESKGGPPYDTTGGGESGGSYWSLGRPPEGRMRCQQKERHALQAHVK